MTSRTVIVLLPEHHWKEAELLIRHSKAQQFILIPIYKIKDVEKVLNCVQYTANIRFQLINISAVETLNSAAVVITASQQQVIIVLH